MSPFITGLRLKSSPTSCIPALHTQLSCSAEPSQTKATFAQPRLGLRKENKHRDEQLQGANYRRKYIYINSARTYFSTLSAANSSYVLAAARKEVRVMEEIRVEHLYHCDGVTPLAASLYDSNKSSPNDL